MFLLPSLLFFGCHSHKLRLLPEVTPHMVVEDLMSFSTRPSLPILIERDGAAIVIHGQSMYGLEPGDISKSREIMRLPYPVVSRTTISGRWILLGNGEKDERCVFDLHKGEIVYHWQGKEAVSLIGVGSNQLVFQGAHNIYIRSLSPNSSAWELPFILPEDRHPLQSAGRLFFFREETLLKWVPQDYGRKEWQLPELSSRDGLVVENSLYYGSIKRNLICCSLANGKKRWAVKLPDELRFPPVYIPPYIVVVVRGDTLFWIRKNGTVDAWTPLPSMSLFQPLALKHHLFVCLQNREVHFYEQKKGNVKKVSMNAPAASPPIRAGDTVYLMQRISSDERRLVRIINRRAVDILVQPEKSETGRSVRIALTAVNLMHPIIETWVEKNGEAVVAKTAFPSIQATLNWIPQKGGKYTLHGVARDDLGQIPFSREIDVVDWRSICAAAARFRRY